MARTTYCRTQSTILLTRQPAIKLHIRLDAYKLEAYFLFVLNISNFDSNIEHLWHGMIVLFDQKKKTSVCHAIFVWTYLFFCVKDVELSALFNQKKNTSKSHGLLVETYGVETSCSNHQALWTLVSTFKSDDFNVSGKQRENRPRNLMAKNLKHDELQD